LLVLLFSRTTEPRCPLALEYRSNLLFLPYFFLKEKVAKRTSNQFALKLTVKMKISGFSFDRHKSGPYSTAKKAWMALCAKN
jgi:hypothetical protein